MIKLFIGFILTMLIIGCDAVHDMSNVLEKKDLMEAEIKSKYGWQSLVGYKIDNGHLKHVSLVLDAREIRNETIPYLENIAKDITLKYFKLKPEVIYIQIATLPDNPFKSKKDK